MEFKNIVNDWKKQFPILSQYTPSTLYAKADIILIGLRLDKVMSDTYRLILEILPLWVQEKRKIKLMLRTKFSIECTPIEIVDYKNKKCFKVIHKNKERNISIERVSGLELLGKKFPLEEYSGETVIFKLTGSLAQRYDLRENEKITENF